MVVLGLLQLVLKRFHNSIAILQLLQKDNFLDQFTFGSLTLILQIDSFESEDVLFLSID